MRWRFFVLIPLCLWTLYTLHLQLSTKEKALYENLIAKSERLRKQKAIENKQIVQRRENVQKQILFPDQNESIQIQSSTSQLTFLEKNKRIEFEEALTDIQCLHKDFQLRAKQGLYTYPSHQLILQGDCHVQSGPHNWSSPELHFDFFQETLHSTTPLCHFLLPKGSFLTLSSHTLIWNKKTSQITLFQQVYMEEKDLWTLEADKGIIELRELKPTHIFLEGHIHLFSNQLQQKESHAIADSLFFDVLQETLLLKAEKKVLFWQEGCNLSADEILIHKDHTVEAKGNVQFSFSLEEKKTIEELLEAVL